MFNYEPNRTIGVQLGSIRYPGLIPVRILNFHSDSSIGRSKTQVTGTGNRSQVQVTP